MRKTTYLKKLVLTRETLRALDLAAVAGGDPVTSGSPTNDCPPKSGDCIYSLDVGNNCNTLDTGGRRN